VTKHADVHVEFHDIEEMVRAAGGYLEVSDDLRPRTLEDARDERSENSIRSWIAVLAAVVVCLAICTHLVRGRLSSPFKAVTVAGCHQLHAAAEQRAAQTNVDLSWSLVDVFSELRQRQSSLIADAL
jgi:hypothetical protein